jgi:di/tricarboxylate transporter
VPIGITSIAIGVIQALLLIRPARTAFTDYMDPSVWFIFGSLLFGMVFTKTGLARRMAYKILSLVGERTSLIYLGCFAMTVTLTLIMAHTAVAATVFPLFLAIYAPIPMSPGLPASARACSSGWLTWPARAASSPCWAPPARPSPWASSRTSRAVPSASSS